MQQVKEIALQGLWSNNPGLVQLLGLCPLLAVTGSITNGLGLGLATTAVLVGSSLTVSLVRNWVPQEIRIPVFVLVIAAFVTCVQLLMNAYAYGLYQSLGIFIPLIVTNCVIIGRAEAFAAKNRPSLAAFDGLMMGAGFSCVLVVLGGIRELLGNGTLFEGMEQLLGTWASGLRIQLFHPENSFLLAILPPGAFIGMGFLIALKNVIDRRLARKQAKVQPAVTIQRVRVTGKI